MKTFKILLIITLSALSSYNYSQEKPNSKAEQKARTAQAVQEAVKKGNINITIEKVITNYGYNEDVTAHDYYLIIKDGILTCQIPFFEKNEKPATSIIIPRKELEETKIDLIKSDPRPGIHLIKFNTRADIGLEIFRFSITIFDSGFCTINLNPSKKNNIIYQGTLKL